MSGLPYYPRYPRDFFEGTAGMPFEEKAAYGLLIDLMMMMGDRGLPDDPHFISGHLGMSVRKWNSIKKRLLERGKIYLANGLISNFRADKQKIIQRKYRDNQAEKAAAPRKNKDLQQPETSHIKIQSNTLTKVSGADAPVDALWKEAVPLLKSAGHTDRAARSLIGKWRKAGPDARVLAAVRSAAEIKSPDPAAYVTAALQGRPSREDERNAGLLKAWT